MLLRCEKHPSKPYRYTANPVGYPKTATICGREKCENPGKAPLNELNGDNTELVKPRLSLTVT